MAVSRPLDRVELFGFDFIDAPSIDLVAHSIVDEADTDFTGGPSTEPSEKLPIVVTPNVDHLVQLDRRSNIVSNEIAERAAFVLPDGQPIVWASRLLHRPLRTRLAGSSLVDVLWPRLISEGRRSFVVASSTRIAALVEAEGEHLSAVVAPMLDLQDRVSFDRFVREATESALAHDSRFVFVGLGLPKQCNVIHGMIRSWPADQPLPMFIAIGASFDMHYLLIRRAPQWMQRFGLEWFFRFVQEPRRLFRRYFIHDTAFLHLLFRQWRSTP